MPNPVCRHNQVIDHEIDNIWVDMSQPIEYNKVVTKI